MSSSYETVNQAIGAAAQANPAAIALLGPDGSAMSYGELTAAMRSVGWSLRNHGVSAQHRVTVIVPNGRELAILALAVSAASICVPLDPRSPEDELVARMNDVQPALVVAHAEIACAFAAARRAGVPCVDASAMIAMSPSQEQEQALDSGPSPTGNDVAFILHTSGTTARPKRVPLTQRNVCRSAANVAKSLRLDRSDRCLNVMPLFHVHGLVGALLASMCSGASIACLRGFEPGRFAEWLDAFAPTWYTAVPTVHHAALADLSHHDPARPHRLRFVRSSSAALAPSLANALQRRLGVPVVEAYGMTEAAHQIASHDVADAGRARGSVGRAAGPSVAILDAGGTLHERDASGEIVIRGDNVMRGYEADADANAAAFRDGWFRTGDQGTIDADGYLWITARIKEIVKRGGAGIAPREIEEALLADADVRECAAFAVPHPTLGEDLAAAVVLVAGSRATGPSLRAALFGRLSESHIPSRIVVVDALERSASGKVQRIGLWKKLAAKLDSDHVAPRTGTEQRIAAIFAEVLEIDSVGANDNFFALGGDSLRGTQALSRIDALCGIELEPATLFRFPTPSELARIVDGHEGIAATT